MTLPARVASLPDGIAEGARSDAASVARLLRQLVRAPSRGGIDPYGPVVGVVEGWLGRRGLLPRVLHRGTDPVAVVCDVTGAAGPGRHYVLDACLDTASFGDEAAWRHPPTSGAVEDGWLYGRGCSDSKAAVAIFCHVAARLADARDRFGGTVTLLFDLDEHTGGFGGIGHYLDEQDATPIDGVLIGYPGPDTVVIGGRGFLRMRISVFGIADHSASKNPRPQNAIVRASHLIGRLRALELPQPVPGDDFDVPPKLTVTSIKGGAPDSYSVVPDRCEIYLDVRLTPRFDDGAAWSLLTSAVADFDRRAAGVRPSIAERTTQSWPPYRLPDGHELPTRLIASAAEAGLHPIPVVAGPSNIGNLLAARGIPATAGFGVRYRNLHGTDEAIELGSIPGVQATYHRAVLDLLHPARKGRSRTQPDATNRAAGVLPMLFHH